MSALAGLRPSKSLRRIAGVTVISLLGLVVFTFIAWPSSPADARQSEAATPADDASLLDAFRHVEAASVSDALEQVTGKKMYMTHHMRPIFPTKFAGFAVTVLLKKEPAAK